mgnify:FL=1
MTEAVRILTLESSITPDFNTIAVHLIIEPVALVRCLIFPDQFTLATPLVIFELADVVAAIRVEHTTETVMFMRRPIAIVACAIWPNLVTATMPL